MIKLNQQEIDLEKVAPRNSKMVLAYIEAGIKPQKDETWYGDIFSSMLYTYKILSVEPKQRFGSDNFLCEVEIFGPSGKLVEKTRRWWDQFI